MSRLTSVIILGSALQMSHNDHCQDNDKNSEWYSSTNCKLINFHHLNNLDFGASTCCLCLRTNPECTFYCFPFPASRFRLITTQNGGMNCKKSFIQFFRYISHRSIMLGRNRGSLRGCESIYNVEFGMASWLAGCPVKLASWRSFQVIDFRLIWRHRHRDKRNRAGVHHGELGMVIEGCGWPRNTTGCHHLFT